MGKLMDAIALLHNCFCEYAGTDGDKTTMSKSEVAKMFRTELGGVINTDKDQKELNDLFAMLDEDGNGVINFQEYIIFVATLSMFAVQCCGQKK